MTIPDGLLAPGGGVSGTGTAVDRDRLSQALDLAKRAIGVTEPNPRVGCVIGTEDGRVLGMGSTQRVGGPHAEVMALRDAQAAGHSVQGATAWVTLEPCAHHGRTPPCCDALIAQGIARVVVAIEDPFPLVAGQGIARMRAAGLRVDFAPADLAAAAHDLNVGFFSRVTRGRPWVRLKMATSLDGRTALLNGKSQWITSRAARADGHQWRYRASAILTGIGTVLADDPRLDARLYGDDWHPLRVVIDPALRTPPQSKLLVPPGRALIAGSHDQGAEAEALRSVGAEVIALPAPQAPTEVDLNALMNHLAALQVNELHVEAGAGLAQRLLTAGLVDELLLYMAPCLLGPGLGFLERPVLTRLEERVRWTFIEVAPVERDLRMRLRLQSDEPGSPAAPTVSLDDAGIT